MRERHQRDRAEADVRAVGGGGNQGVRPNSAENFGVTSAVFAKILRDMLGPRDQNLLSHQVSHTTTALLQLSPKPAHLAIRDMVEELDLEYLKRVRSDTDGVLAHDPHLAQRDVYNYSRPILNRDDAWGVRSVSDNWYNKVLEQRLWAILGRARLARIPTRLEIDYQWDGDVERVGKQVEVAFPRSTDGAVADKDDAFLHDRLRLLRDPPNEPQSGTALQIGRAHV